MNDAELLDPYALLSQSLSLDVLSLDGDSQDRFRLVRASDHCASFSESSHVLCRVAKPNECSSSTLERAGRRNRIFQNIMPYVDIVPMRLSRPITNDQLSESLNRQQVRLKSALEHIRGRVQIDIRWLIERDSDRHMTETVTTSGSDYLRDKFRTSKEILKLESELSQLSNEYRTAQHSSGIAVSKCQRCVSGRQLGDSDNRQYHLVGLDLLVTRNQFAIQMEYAKQLKFRERPPHAVCGPVPAFSFLAPLQL